MMSAEAPHPPASARIRDVIACVAFDYGGTLTSLAAAIAPHLGMRPLDQTVIPALRLLHRWGIRLLVASNTRPHQDRRQALHHAGVAHLFTDVLTSTRLRTRKPEPAFYDAVLRAADCPPDRVLFVGNNPNKDVRAPMRHGMRAVHIDQTGSAPELPAGAFRITHLTQLPRLVAELCA